MSTWSISKKTKNKILVEAKKLDKYDVRILYLLRNLGPLRFTTLIDYSGLSRSTVSKYLKYHLSQNNIEKKIFKNISRNTQEQRYFVTELGIEKLGEDYYGKSDIIYFNELNDFISKISGLIDFYKEIGVADSIVDHIVGTISKMGDNYLLIDQNRDLYLTLFYIYHNSVLTRDFKFEIIEFCKLYNVKKIRIDFYIDKIMSDKLGFYMFTRGEDIFFFHEEDILGTITNRFIRDKLIKKMIEINLNIDKKSFDLDLNKAAEEIAENLIVMELIWEANEEIGIRGIREPFEMLIEKIFIKTALELGIPKPSLWDMALQSEKLSKAEGGIKSLINIIEGSVRYEDLNLVSISESEETILDQNLEKIQGFCPKCGKTILKKDLSNFCHRCANKFDENNLIKKVDEAIEKSMKYKKEILQMEILIECPNPNCHYNVKSGWDVCPECLTSLKESESKKVNIEKIT